jgi:hypothetical protein
VDQVSEGWVGGDHRAIEGADCDAYRGGEEDFPESGFADPQLQFGLVPSLAQRLGGRLLLAEDALPVRFRVTAGQRRRYAQYSNVELIDVA